MEKMSPNTKHLMRAKFISCEQGRVGGKLVYLVLMAKQQANRASTGFHPSGILYNIKLGTPTPHPLRDFSTCPPKNDLLFGVQNIFPIV